MIGLNHGIKKTKAIFISLGGAPAPIIKSLNKQKPDYICFLVSKLTRKDIQTVIEGLEYKPIHHDWIETPSAEGLSETFKAIYDKLGTILAKWGIGYEDLMVDYTGGTKTMSVAIVLSTIDNVSKYSYVGGVERTKDGVGIVIDGKERMLFSDNPWNQMATKVKREVSLLFNKGRYSSALDIIRKDISKFSGELQIFFEYIADAIEGYDLWDRFYHKDALHKISKALEKVEPYSIGKDDIDTKKLKDSMDKNKDFLDQLVNNKGEQDRYKVLDLLSNAMRRADEYKYDDAVARLYRVIEAYGQFSLKSKYGIEASSVKPEDIPEKLREDYIKKYCDEDRRIKIPLYALYNLLKEKGDELGLNFFKYYNDILKTLLNIRNNSILGHGFIPVKKETLQKMYEAILSFTGIEKDSLPIFPEFKL